MAKLNDMQTILLSTAAQRVGGNLLPPPDSVGATDERIRTAIGALIKRAMPRSAPSIPANAPGEPRTIRR